MSMPHYLSVILLLLLRCNSCHVVAFQASNFRGPIIQSRLNKSFLNSQRTAEPPHDIDTISSYMPFDPEKNQDYQHRASLISSFLVEILTEENDAHVWSLAQIEDIVSASSSDNSIINDNVELSSGAKSWQSLHTRTQVSPTIPSAVVFKSRLTASDNTIRIDILPSASFAASEHRDLLHVLPRVIAQYTANAAASSRSSWDLTITSKAADNEQTTTISNVSLCCVEGVRNLFDAEPSVEIVDMVDRTGQVLGMVPRNLVHSLNILHRGIGLTVSKDVDFSQLYVHRRTDFKRIFPSLYDMFVGGVSASGENARLTAAREVAEELGLNRAFAGDGPEGDNKHNNALSDPLFSCVVCTSYNRCVVTVFQYTMNPALETISWQVEEVSWGEFVPYNIVEAAADLSIQRLVERKEWPGRYPAVQSKWEGSKPPYEKFDGGDWEAWDFVPDGLLVWEAWLKWRQNQGSQS